MRTTARRTQLTLAIILACLMWTTTAMAATSTEVVAAIEKALAYLHDTQTPGGYWPYGGYEPAATGAAAYAMLVQKGHWGTNATQYQTDVDEAIAYLLANATKTTVSTRNDGVNICPGGSGSCDGVYWQANNNEDTYTTGLIAPAIAAYGFGRASAVATTSGPLANMTFGEIAQGIVNMFAANQSTTVNGNRQGGWRYYPGQGDSDMSTTQWAIISILYAQSLGAATPQIVKDDLAVWLSRVQAGDGSGCYQPGTQPCDHSDTGGMLLGLNLVGKSVADASVQNAIGFLDTNWQGTANSFWYGNFGHPYATWSVYKGLETTIGQADTTYITNLRPGQCGNDLPAGACNWWQDYVEWIVTNQQADGSWSGYVYWSGPLSTGFFLSILPPGARIPASLDPFHCYRIKDSKGNMCTAAAPTNVGGSCTTEADCGGTKGQTNFCAPKDFPKNLGVSLTDQFNSKSFDLNNPVVLCAPASVDGSAINNTVSHLEGYQADPSTGGAYYEPQKNLTITNQFHPNGDLKVDALKPQRLLVPTSKSLTAPVPAPTDKLVDHYTCYAAVISAKAPKFPTDLQVTLVDQFDQEALYGVVRPSRLCTPVNKNNEGVKNPDTHLMCYQLQALKGQPLFTPVSRIYVNNQFGPGQVDAFTNDDLCVPSTKTLPTP